MKTKDAPKDLTLIQLFDRFGTEAKARKHLEGILWPKGIICPHCQTNDQVKFSTIAANPDKKVRAGLRWCSNCQKQFTVTIGTIFEDSHKWANEPLKFAVNPDVALAKGALKPKKSRAKRK
jgi:hypothetical protein